MFDVRDSKKDVVWCYQNLGWSFIRLNGKVPMDIGWHRGDRLPLDVVLKHQGNIGLRTGNGLVVVDIDEGADLSGLELPETVEVKTGSGARHLYYRTNETIRNSTGKLGPHIDIRGDGGQVVFPGSVHPDTKQRYEFVRAPWECEIAPLPESIIQKLKAKPQQPATTTAGAKTAYARVVMENELNRVRMAPEGQRNDTLNRAAFKLGQFIASGELNQSMVEMALESAAMSIGLEASEIRSTIRSGINSGLEFPRQTPPRTINRNDRTINDDVIQQEKPKILVPGVHQDDSDVTHCQSVSMFADDVLSSLPPDLIYVRSHIPGEIVGEPGKRRWLELNENKMRLRIDDHLEMVQWRESKDGVRFPGFMPCTKDWAGLVIAACASSNRCRTLDLITNYPVYLPGWRRAEPGWHDGVYYDESDDLRGISPIRDLEEIRYTLDELVTDFPFADEASKHNYYGLLLTPLVYPAIRANRPLHLITASLERTGKSKLAEDVLGGIILGSPTPAMQISGTDEERDKRILALLLQGGTLVHLDNLPRKLDSAALASMLTARVYQGRRLGSTHILSLPNNLTVVATGNNTVCSSEMAKRIIPIRLQPMTSRPEDRTTFQHPDLKGFITENRRRIMACLLGMIENWIDRGCPPHPQPLGGFEEWSRAVGGILDVNLLQQWRKNEKAWRGMSDVEGEQRVALVKAWWERAKTADMTTDEVLRIAEDLEGFEWIFSVNTQRGRQIRMGKWLKQHADTPIDKWVVRCRQSGNRNIYYLVESK